MSLNQYQNALESAESAYVEAEKGLERAMRAFRAAQTDFHIAERRVFAETVCKWCHGNPCTCPKVAEARSPKETEK